MVSLVIVESPAKCDTIAKYLGPGYIVRASFGHVRDLPNRGMGVSPTDYSPNYVVSPSRKRKVASLRRLAGEADAVFLATDPDREGEAISWHLQEVLGLDHTSCARVTFNEITPASIARAFDKAGTIDMNLVAAQEGRRIIDRLVGYSVSPALSKAYGGHLTAGRVQSVAVRLVVEKEQQINAFAPIDYFDVELAFVAGNFVWKAEWLSADYLHEGQRYNQDVSLAELIAATRRVKVITTETSPYSRRPPAPFITSTLQQAASTLLSYSPKHTMQLAQNLFNLGLITYHRTDNPNLSQAGYEDVVYFLNGNGFSNDVSVSMQTWKANASAQEGHEAIRPTSIMNLPREVLDEHGESMGALYQIIWYRTVACQMKAAKYMLTTTLLESDSIVNGQRPRFAANGRDLQYPGWLKLAKTSEDLLSEDQSSQTGANDQLLPSLSEGVKLDVFEGCSIAKKTKPPRRYTEASLVKKLEQEGVGRPSTYASILDTITNRGYAKLVSRKLHATDMGFVIYNLLATKFSFMETSYTSLIEKQLDRLASGECGYFEVVDNVFKQLEVELSSLDGAVVEGRESHSVQSNCNVVEPDKTYPCECGEGYLQLREGSNGSFFGCSTYPQCTVTRGAVNGKPDEQGKECPTCHSGQLVTRSIKHGKNVGKQFRGCSLYPDCKHFCLL